MSAHTEIAVSAIILGAVGLGLTYERQDRRAPGTRKDIIDFNGNLPGSTKALQWICGGLMVIPAVLIQDIILTLVAAALIILTPAAQYYLHRRLGR